MTNISSILSKFAPVAPVAPTISDVEAEIRLLIVTLKTASSMLPGLASVDTYNFPEVEAAQKLITEHASELTEADLKAIITGLKQIVASVEAEVTAALIGRIKENPDASLTDVIHGVSAPADESETDTEEDDDDFEDEYPEDEDDDEETEEEDFDLGEGVKEVVKSASDLVSAIRSELNKTDGWKEFAALMKTFNIK